jgi:hypothetical protein
MIRGAPCGAPCCSPYQPSDLDCRWILNMLVLERSFHQGRCTTGLLKTKLFPSIDGKMNRITLSSFPFKLLLSPFVSVTVRCYPEHLYFLPLLSQLYGPINGFVSSCLVRQLFPLSCTTSISSGKPRHRRHHDKPINGPPSLRIFV